MRVPSKMANLSSARSACFRRIFSKPTSSATLPENLICALAAEISEVYFSFSAAMKLWGGSLLRVGRTKEAAVRDVDSVPAGAVISTDPPAGSSVVSSECRPLRRVLLRPPTLLVGLVSNYKFTWAGTGEDGKQQELQLEHGITSRMIGSLWVKMEPVSS